MLKILQIEKIRGNTDVDHDIMSCMYVSCNCTAHMIKPD
jgi:hypothetical protein